MATMYSQFFNNTFLKICLLHSKSLSDTPALEETKLPFLELCLFRDITKKAAAAGFSTYLARAPLGGRDPTMMHQRRARRAKHARRTDHGTCARARGKTMGELGQNTRGPAPPPPTPGGGAMAGLYRWQPLISLTCECVKALH